MAADDVVMATQTPTRFQLRWGWLLVLGIVQVICGAVALLIPTAASVAAALFFGALLIVAGVFQAVHAFRVRPWKGMVLHTLGALLYVAAGGLILAFPLGGALTLTIVVGTLLIADGVVRYLLAIRLRPREGWGWIMVAGVVGTAVGILLLVDWPATGLWAIGVLLGANLLFIGATHIVLALTFRSREARNTRGELDHAHPGA
jgi:uncharacterized membrane protein HdeD (DUF308 family)